MLKYFKVFRINTREKEPKRKHYKQLRVKAWIFFQLDKTEDFHHSRSQGYLGDILPSYLRSGSKSMNQNFLRLKKESTAMIAFTVFKIMNGFPIDLRLVYANFRRLRVILKLAC